MENPFDGYIGQGSLIKTIKQYLTLPTFPNVFFSATKGCGKSELARRIATANGKQVKELGCRSNMKLDDILYNLLLKWHGGVIFFDELPIMSKSNQASLRTLLETGVFYNVEGEAYPFPHLTVLAAGTDITKVDDDLLDRFDILEFERYSHDDLTAIGQGFNVKFETNLEYSVIEKLAFACSESPRKMRQLIEYSAKSLISSDQKPTIDAILETARIDADGMSPLERTVMLEMAEFASRGVSPTISRIATALRTSERSLRVIFENLEGYGFVSVAMGPSGRKFTPDGIRKLHELRDN